MRAGEGTTLWSGVPADAGGSVSAANDDVGAAVGDTTAGTLGALSQTRPVDAGFRSDFGESSSSTSFSGTVRGRLERRMPAGRRCSFVQMLVAVFPLLLTAVYTLLCPSSKVEESFNIQAVHDVLFWRTDLDRYDHLEFPGVVPRTFLGPIGLAALSAPVGTAVSYLGMPKVYALLTARLMLAVVLWSGFRRFVAAVEARFGRRTARCLVAVTCVQFHFLFYSSRTLPNTFASAASTCIVYTDVAAALSAYALEQLLLCGVLACGSFKQVCPS